MLQLSKPSRVCSDMKADTVRIVSRRMVQPSYGTMPMPPSEEIHLTPWDLTCTSYKYIQTGIVLPKPPAGGETSLVDTLVASLARALARHYPFAGRLGVVDHGDGTVTIPLCCTGEGAELVHAVAPGVSVADVVASPLYTTSSAAFFPLNGVYGANAAIDSSLPVLCAQVSELADGVFIAMAMNHAVGDGTSFWELFNAWSSINRGDELTRAPAPVHRRWFVDTSPVPIPFPLNTLQQVFEMPSPVQNGFFTFSATSVKKLKAKANHEMVAATTTISSLQALIAHLWCAVTRARRLPPGEETCCSVVIGCRRRMRDIPPGYVGNALSLGITKGCTAGDILDKGLGWTALQLQCAVESFDEEDVRGWLDRWAREPTLETYRGGGGGLAIAGSPRFDVFGNDFGWGKPVGVRSSPGEMPDGLVSAFEGPEQEGGMSLDVSLAPETMERLVADHEFMEAVAA